MSAQMTDLTDEECTAIADEVSTAMGATGGTLTESEGHYLRNFGFALIRAGYRAKRGVPVAWLVTRPDGWHTLSFTRLDVEGDDETYTPLYAAPPADTEERPGANVHGIGPDTDGGLNLNYR